MARFSGELRDGKLVCEWLGCEELAAYDHATGICVACADHLRRFQAGESFPVCPFPGGAKYVVANCKAIPLLESKP